MSPCWGTVVFPNARELYLTVHTGEKPGLLEDFSRQWLVRASVIGQTIHEHKSFIFRKFTEQHYRQFTEIGSVQPMSHKSASTFFLQYPQQSAAYLAGQGARAYTSFPEVRHHR